jgi:hypothetical protein
MSVAAAFGQAVVYSADDGTAETSYGVIPASSAIVWMNRFTAAAGANVITAIDVAFGRYFGGSGMLNGAPVALYVWSDPNNDGNPSDGQVLASATGVTANVDTNIFNRYSIGPVVVPVGSNFLYLFTAS